MPNPTPASIRAHAEADQIVRRLLKGDETTYDIRADYGCHLRTINLIYRSRTTEAQRKAAKSRKLSRHRKAVLRAKGQARWGAGASKYAPVGTIRIRRHSQTGKLYHFVKVRDDGPCWRQWVMLARVAWERHSGRPVPKGHHVIHENRNTLDDSPDNLLCLTRAQLLALRVEGDSAAKAKRAAANRRSAISRTSIARAKSEAAAFHLAAMRQWQPDGHGKLGAFTRQLADESQAAGGVGPGAAPDTRAPDGPRAVKDVARERVAAFLSRINAEAA